MALGRLSALAALALSVGACRTRDVYLAPNEAELHVDAGGTGGPVPDSGPRSDASPWYRGDSGRPGCETNRYPEEPQPLGVYILVDQSSTMGTLWLAMSDALSQFIQQSGTLGKVSVGIKYYAVYPNELEPSQNYTDVVCIPATYEKPSVPISLLPGNAPALTTSIAAHQPSALAAALAALHLNFDVVPTDAALTGAIAGATTWATDNAASRPKAVVLLVTNEVPATSAVCLPSVDAAKLAAANGFVATPSITTYVLDVGAPNADLDAIANAGGGDHAYSAANGADMLSALQSIRELALPCEIDVAKHQASLDKLNVELSTADGSTRFSKLPDGQPCDPNRNDEWYLEGTGDTAKVRLCSNTCVHARSMTGATIDVVLGCRTTVD